VSTRTIVEINHDQLNALTDPDRKLFVWNTLLDDLKRGLDSARREYYQSHGVRILGDRHHTEPEWHGGDAAMAALDLELLRVTLLRAQQLCRLALPKFNWGASALDARAIALLNEVPGEIDRTLKTLEPQG
jgi:hypothetical protein